MDVVDTLCDSGSFNVSSHQGSSKWSFGSGKRSIAIHKNNFTGCWDNVNFVFCPFGTHRITIPEIGGKISEDVSMLFIFGLFED